MKDQLNLQGGISVSVVALAAALLVGISTTSAASPDWRPTASSAESAGYLVGFTGELGRAEADLRIQAAGLARSTWIDGLNVAIVNHLAEGPAASSALESMAAADGVTYIEPNYLVRGEDTPNDPHFPTYQYAPQKIGAPAAWDVTVGSSSVTVAVLDTGLDMSHADMDGQYVAGYDFVNDDGDPSDDHGHGTHVSGIVGALTNNSTGVASIGRSTSIMPVKVLNSANQGTHGVVAQGIVWATDQGADVINLSLGSTATSSTLQQAVDYAASHGALVVAAAGNNSSTTPFYPAAYSSVMGIAATDYYDNRWTGSNYGSWISMSAPGASVYSTDWTGGAGAYAFRSGTSQAAPHVSGVAALMLAVDNTLTAGELRSGLESTAADLGPSGFDSNFGWGRLNAAAAVASVGGADPTATPASPTATVEPPPATDVPSTATPVPPTATLVPPTATQPSVPLTISSVKAIEVQQTTAQVRWSTNQPSSSQVEYGTSSSLGSWSQLDTDPVTSHQVGLSGLTRKTTYYYRVHSVTSGGVAAVSSIYSLRTK